MGLIEVTRSAEAYPINSATALIFCGGMGSRAENVTRGLLPKHLLPIRRDKVLLDHSVSVAVNSGVGKTYLVTSHVSAPVIDKYSKLHWDNYNNVGFFEHSSPRAGVAQVFNLFLKSKTISGPIIKLEGDEVNVGFNLKDMYMTHTYLRHPITYLVTKGSGYKYKLRINEQNMVTGVGMFPFEKTMVDDWNLTGVFVINPEEFSLFIKAGSTENFLRQATRQKKLFIYPFFGQSVNVNTENDYMNALKMKL